MNHRLLGAARALRTRGRRAIGRLREHWTRERSLRLARRLGVATLVLALVMAAVPAVRWPVLRLAASTATTLTSPVAPDVDSFDDLEMVTNVVDRKGARIGDLEGTHRRFPTSLDRLPDHAWQAVLVAEDRQFFEHPGVDPTGVARAGVRLLQGDRQGGSTITQQLAKLNFTDGGITIVRKLREVVYAAELERSFTKEELLERYLNQVYFGDGAYGIATAARVFFDAAPSELTLAQAAMLAGKIRAPDRLDPHDVPDEVRDVRNSVLDGLADTGWVDRAEVDAAVQEPLGVQDEEAPALSFAPWFVEYVKQEAQTLDALGPDPKTRLQRLVTGGLRVETTLDLHANVVARRVLAEHLDGPDDPAGAVVSVAPGDGGIRIMVGGTDFAEQKFNAAHQARRQPGSAFKPFVYLGALIEGIDPRSRVLGSSPMDFEYQGKEFDVRNYGNRSYGVVDIDSALVRSINTVFMQLGLEVGPDDVVDTAARAGLPDEIAPVPAASLGGIDPGVTPLEMAGAYATFAADGIRARPYAIARIVDGDGRVVYEHERAAERAFETAHVRVLNRPLLGVVGGGTGRAADLADRDVAGKTGTTTDSRDAWFVGYVPQLATAVWTGHLDNSPMGSVTGGSIPARVFGEVMETVLRGVEPAEIPTVSPADLDLERLPEPSTTSSSTTSTTTTSTTTTSTSVPPTPTTTEADVGASGRGTTSTTASTTTTTSPPPTTTTTAPPSEEGTTSE